MMGRAERDGAEEAGRGSHGRSPARCGVHDGAGAERGGEGGLRWMQAGVAARMMVWMMCGGCWRGMQAG